MASSRVVEFPRDELQYIMHSVSSPICTIDLENRKVERAILTIFVKVPPKFYVAIWSEKRAIVGMIPGTSSSMQYDTFDLDKFLEEANRYLDSGQEHTMIIVRTSKTSEVNAIHWDTFFHHIATQRKEDKIEIILHDPEIVNNPRKNTLDEPDSDDFIALLFWGVTLKISLGKVINDTKLMDDSVKTLTYGKRDTDIILPSEEDDKKGMRGISRGEYIPVSLKDEAAPMETSHCCMDGYLIREMTTLDDVVFFIAGENSCVFRIPIEWTIDEIIKTLRKLTRFCFSSTSPTDKNAGVLCCHPKHLSEEGAKRGADRAKAIKDTTKLCVHEDRWDKSEYLIKGISCIVLTPDPSYPTFTVEQFN
ncbi:uncharacterized protein TRUGW13939_07565 [Talaromyces rugulosus]|uniref:Uncharacterized protein n=1 Tax=Talaromyces rugulosus TaxID=121627 RepID=A0A7H8R215_TALRU|nr:uncharacterized protein TRUGW13939_07565 [Talaromyces rugulosus]QKX60420.1 hypothetical protein TRUGW13939_07565 [Talaromyces rugulosus]